MNLAQKVYNYYYDNRQLLGDDKLFHFATRLAAWRGEPDMFEILKNCRDYIVKPQLPINDVIIDIVRTPQSGRRNAHALRQPFFDKYPDLYGAHAALFRVRHLEAVYGIDARQALFAAIPDQELVELRDSLLADNEALKVLSTFAINFCYLLERVVHKNESSLPVDNFYNLGELYDNSQIEHIQLMIYLYTHCIIGESNFYTRPIPTDKLPTYRKMLARLEPLINDKYKLINLDNKLEFLVCSRICGYVPKIDKRIYEECAQSISPEGTFIIDTHNDNIQSDRNDFIKSEHRNVLFIMSSSEYNPHSTLVG